jgi:hypothetical protein
MLFVDVFVDCCERNKKTRVTRLASGQMVGGKNTRYMDGAEGGVTNKTMCRIARATMPPWPTLQTMTGMFPIPLITYRCQLRLVEKSRRRLTQTQDEKE